MLNRIINYTDSFLNSITMYLLLLRGLQVMGLIAILLGFLGFLPYGGTSYLVSLLILLIVCHFSNLLLAKFFKAPANVESSYITGLILFFIMFPATSMADVLSLIVAAVVAVASKYLLALDKKHVFNPAALGALVVGISGLGGAIWWVGSTAMLLPNLILALLILRKVRRFQMFSWFLGASLVTVFIIHFAFHHPTTLNHTLLRDLWKSLVSWPILFFGSIMLTEPLTSPPTRKLKAVYAVIAGAIMNIPFDMGFISASPELALCLANIFSYFTSLRKRFILELAEKKEIAREIYEFAFKNKEDKPIDLGDSPGQYLEWTLVHDKPDSRGFRRYFSIASGFDEKYLKIGVKITEDSSTFKKSLLNMKEGETIAVGALSGDFILPKNTNEKLVFIAGGIGVTPFRSMVKSIMLSKEKRDVIFYYSVKTEKEIAYKDVFEAAQQDFSLHTIYLVGNFLNTEMIRRDIPDFLDRTFYLSGPNAMVENYKKMLHSLGVRKIMTDYFPGY